MTSRRQPDEDDVRIRPGRHKARARTKDRPGHLDAVDGRVVAVDRGRFNLVVGDHSVYAMKARELGRKGVVVGDEVSVVGDSTGKDDALARIVRVSPRRSVLRRTADDTDPIERVIVANADQLVVVTATMDPEPRPRLIDRCLAAAYDAGLAPLLCITKADLASPEPLLAAYAALDVPHVVMAQGGNLDILRERLAGRTSVLIGHSGVGKSTLVNALVPGTCRAVGHVNEVTGRGRHTSSSAIALRLPGDVGWIIDTPGVRSFGLAHVDPARLLSTFPDLAAGTAACPRGCTHDEPECGLDAWVAQGHAGPGGAARLDSLRRLLRARTADVVTHEGPDLSDPNEPAGSGDARS